MFKFSLGVELEDAITGYTGIAMGRTEYLTGCNQYGLLNRKPDKDGVPRDWRWFDENRLRPTGKSVKLPGHEEIEKDPGGPCPFAPENN